MSKKVYLARTLLGTSTHRSSTPRWHFAVSSCSQASACQTASAERALTLQTRITSLLSCKDCGTGKVWGYGAVA